MKIHRRNRNNLGGKAIFLIFFVFIVGQKTIKAEEILKYLKKIVLDQKESLIASASDFCVLEDECFVICDFKDQKVLVYDHDGKYLSGWKKLGQGPGEYQGMWLNGYQAPHLAIVDLRQPKILLYERTGKGDFSWIKDIPESGRTITDFILNNGELFFETTILHNERYYFIHIRDLDAKKDEYLLPAAVRYGGRPEDNHLRFYEAEYSKIWGKPYAFIDVLDGQVYSAWTGDLKIFKIDRKTKKWITFGQKTKNYRPIKLEEIKYAPGLTTEQLFEENRRASAKYSWIGGIFADQGLIGLLYITFDHKASKWNVFLQLYDSEGVFLKELKLPDVIPIEVYLLRFYSRESGCLYFLNMIDEEDKEIGFEILKYKIR